MREIVRSVDSTGCVILRAGEDVHIQRRSDGRKMRGSRGGKPRDRMKPVAQYKDVVLYAGRKSDRKWHEVRYGKKDWVSYSVWIPYDDRFRL